MVPPAARTAKKKSGEAAFARSPKRRAILEAAARVFLESGYGAASMDVIAAGAGVSKQIVNSEDHVRSCHEHRYDIPRFVSQTLETRFRAGPPRGRVSAGNTRSVFIGGLYGVARLGDNPPAIHYFNKAPP